MSGSALLDEVLKAMNGNGEVVPHQTTQVNADDACMVAERVATVADDLCLWASGTPEGSAALERWRAAAVVRQLANERWSEATRQLRLSMPSGLTRP